MAETAHHPRTKLKPTDADMLFVEVKLILDNRFLTALEILPKTRTLIEDICRKAVVPFNGVHPTYLPGRIDFVCEQYGLEKTLKQALHTLRIQANRVLHAGRRFNEYHGKQALVAIAEAISGVWGKAVPQELREALAAKTQPRMAPAGVEETALGYSAEPEPMIISPENPPYCLRVIFEELETDGEPFFYCHASEDPETQPLRVQFDVPDLNKPYTPSVKGLQPGAVLNLVDLQPCHEPGVLLPRHIVLEPDYLVDVTAIAECALQDGLSSVAHMVRLFQPNTAGSNKFKGTAVNVLLDEMVRARAQGEPFSVNDFIGKALFKRFPLELTVLYPNEPDATALIGVLKAHAAVLESSFYNPEQRYRGRIKAEQAHIEPSFLSAKYGLQGRLDILQKSPEGWDVIELKAGSPPYGRTVRPNHDAQTRLYLLLLDDVERPSESNVVAHILYSEAEADPVRVGGKPNRLADAHLLNLRNEIVLLELGLARAGGSADAEFALSWLTETDILGLPGFLRAEVEAFLRDYHATDNLTRSYFLAFSTFAMREKRIAKMGGDTSRNQGQADLWRVSEEEKQGAFTFLPELRIVKDADTGELADEHFITFRRPAGSDAIVSFRQGSNVIVYPQINGRYDILKTQLVKGQVERISRDEVRVYFRHRQFLQEFWLAHEVWALEPDLLDNNFENMLRATMGFVRQPTAFRDLLLCRRAPEQPAPYHLDAEGLSDDQRRILEKALGCQDYFLLVGPPGTGKTSVILHRLTKALFEHSQESFLLVAYTNRAVDEICQQVESLGLGFIRVGSHLNTAPAFRKHLLQEQTREISRRADLRAWLQDCRIFVGTLAAISTKPELFVLKKFDTAIVDEASQVLEPQLLDLLGNVRRFILIGDHNQLPAVVVQSPEESRTADTLLQAAGIHNLRVSLFERLFRSAQQKGWHHCLDQLRHQGRMHNDIADFVSNAFYEGGLELAEPARQSAPLPEYKGADANLRLLGRNRLAFISCTEAPAKLSKHNPAEASIIVSLVESFVNAYGEAFNPETTLGIITPFRNQIATILQELEGLAERLGRPDLLAITVDTVERYQGGQRDVILVSFSVSWPLQLQMIASLTEDNRVDRKLNVALSRARERIVLVGNEQVLSFSPLYRNMLEYIRQHDGFMASGLFTKPNATAAPIQALSPEFTQAFESLVVSPLRADKRTEWPNKVMGNSHTFNQLQATEFGYGDYSESLSWCGLGKAEKTLAGADRAALAVYYHLPQQVAAAAAALQTLQAQLDKIINRNIPMAYGLEVGGMPWGLALAASNNRLISANVKHWQWATLEPDRGLQHFAKHFASQRPLRGHSLTIADNWEQLMPNNIVEPEAGFLMLSLNWVFCQKGLNRKAMNDCVFAYLDFARRHEKPIMVLCLHNPLQKLDFGYTDFKINLRQLANEVYSQEVRYGYSHPSRAKKQQQAGQVLLDAFVG